MPNDLDPLHQTLMQRRLDAAARAGERAAARRTLFVVVREPDLPALARGLARVIADMPSDDRQAWLANFTKVRLFAGHPGRTAVAALLSHIQADTLGFALIDAEARHPRLADLLVPLKTRTGPDPDSEIELVWDEGEGRWELEIDVGGLDWPRYLVHVLHLLAEAAIVDPGFGGRIRLKHRSAAPVCTEDAVQLRLDLDESPPGCRAVLRPETQSIRSHRPARHTTG